MVGFGFWYKFLDVVFFRFKGFSSVELFIEVIDGFSGLVVGVGWCNMGI